MDLSIDGAGPPPGQEILVDVASLGWQRLGLFIGLLLLFSLTESLWPRRQRHLPRASRWPVHGGLIVIATLLVRILVPITPLAVAAWVGLQGYGLLPHFQTLRPSWHDLGLGPALDLAVFATALFCLDLAIYLQHRAFHKVPVLWRLHRVHHTDTELDATTAVRFHPLEILLSTLFKMGVIVILGPSVVAVFTFECLLSGCALFNHSNTRVPHRLDRVVRWVIVTPDMHRIHHSVHQWETDSNFGFCLSCWDRLLRTHVPQPQDGQTTMEVGLADFRSSRDRSLAALLRQPWRTPTAPQPTESP